MRNLLFVCSRNQWRSPTAERLFLHSPDFTARSAGTASSARRRVSQDLLDWADIVFCMESHHARQIRQRFQVRGTLHVLDIPDDYERDDPELVELLRRRTSGKIGGLQEEGEAGDPER